MLRAEELLAAGEGFGECFGWEVGLAEQRVHIVGGCFRRVFHVGGVEAVIAQVVDNSLVGRKVFAACIFRKILHRQHQGGFAYVVAVQPVGKVSYGTYGVNEGAAEVEYPL